MPLDVESKATLDEVVDRFQAAAQQVLLTAKQDLATQVSEAISQVSLLATAKITELEVAMAPVLAESQAWRKLIAGGFQFGAKS
jgi:ACT domain-containing protein